MYIRFIVCVIALVSFFYLMPKAFFYGGIWERRAHPQSNVSVEFKSGDKKTGVYTRTWSGKYQLTTSDGNTIEFESFNSMTHPMNESNDDGILIFSNWRLLVFPALLFTGYFVIFMAFLGLSFLRNKEKSEH